MNVFIVDSNVVFSAILNIENKMGQFIMSSDTKRIAFYAPDYLRIEIERYVPKIISLSQMEEKEVRRIMNLLYAKITFIADSLIPFEFYSKALPFIRDIDMDDLVFVALNEYLDEVLWTGDMKLYNGLKKKGYNKVVTFSDIQKMLKTN
jgi:predicted nucleic acid-binding protein